MQYDPGLTVCNSVLSILIPVNSIHLLWGGTQNHVRGMLTSGDQYSLWLNLSYTISLFLIRVNPERCRLIPLPRKKKNIGSRPLLKGLTKLSGVSKKSFKT